jgi:hypothetical protein
MPPKPASAPHYFCAHRGVRAECDATTPTHKEIELARKVSFCAGERSFVTYQEGQKCLGNSLSD